ncbi:hypothetical protein [Parabacteroides goldsteinii]|uniref:hypothetical protein n=1 Tax=Parabacteroides goldsteinii TaxID=328812 RepID=UPI00259B3DD0|nr:hypothetical protein [Parabacteroides goldsteinii]
MNCKFKSNFGEALSGLIEEKQALGIKFESYKAKLIQFDSFCSNEYPEETILNQELVLNWLHFGPVRLLQICRNGLLLCASWQNIFGVMVFHRLFCLKGLLEKAHGTMGR